MYDFFQEIVWKNWPASIGLSKASMYVPKSNGGEQSITEWLTTSPKIAGP
jgi:hypothetical protein